MYTEHSIHLTVPTIQAGLALGDLLYQTSFQGEDQVRGVRTPGLQVQVQECVCVPAHKCPQHSGQVVR